MYRWPSPSKPRSTGELISAAVAGPPSPERPGAPVPATVVITPSWSPGTAGRRSPSPLNASIALGATMAAEIAAASATTPAAVRRTHRWRRPRATTVSTTLGGGADSSASNPSSPSLRRWSSDIFALLNKLLLAEQLGESFPRPVEVHFGRHLCTGQDLRNLADRPILHIEERHRCPLRWRKLPNGSEEVDIHRFRQCGQVELAF